jgi:putative heme-binding domain-containing protein
MNRYFFVAVFLLASPTWLFAQRNLKDLPDPNPEVEKASFVLPPGFEFNLFASEPMIAKPIQMNWDADGRLWIASSEVYPQIKPGQESTDKILVIEDTDGDGVADSRTVFADKLLIPTGVAPGDGGVYVANSTELLHFKDTNGDGVSDQKRIVLSGFGTEDTHHLLHTLRWGMDGALYMNQSIYIHSHVETPHGVKRMNGGGIWRFRPNTLELDTFCLGFVNAWGHHQDRWGQSFATDGAYGEGINYVFPGSVFVSSPGARRILTGLNPGSPKHCGLEILSGEHLPPEWRGTMITNDFRGNRTCRFVVTDDAAGYASRQVEEVIKSTHMAYRPVDVKMGPDGAIYIADWYNPIIQHGEVDFRDERRDQTRGRIWRVTAKGRPLVAKKKLSKASIDELLANLTAEEEWVRIHSKRELFARGSEKVIPALQKWMNLHQGSDEANLAARLEGLWLYQHFGLPELNLLSELASAPDYRVRAAALRVATAWRASGDPAIDALKKGVADDHHRVRLEAVRGLVEIGDADAAKTMLLALDKPLDRNLDFAVWQSCRDLKDVWLPLLGASPSPIKVGHALFALESLESREAAAPALAMLRETGLSGGQVSRIMRIVASQGGSDELKVAFESAAKTSALGDETKAAVYRALADTARQRQLRPEGDLSALVASIDSANEGVAIAAMDLAGAWKLSAAQQPLRTKVTSKASANVQTAAISAIGALGGAENADFLTKLIDAPESAAELKTAGVISLNQIDPKAAIARLVALFAAKEVPAGAQDALRSILQNKDAAPQVAVALKTVKLTSDNAKLALRVAQSAAQPSPELVEAIRTAGGLAESAWKPTPELIASLAADVMKQGDPAHGESLFRRADLLCFKCHAIGGAGGRVGPDLTSIGGSAQVDYLVESIINPNAKIKENYHSQTVLDDDGRQFTGIKLRESETELVLLDAEDKEVSIPKVKIDTRGDGRSLMPDGAADLLTRKELVDLVSFLARLGKVGDFAVGKERVVRRWEALTPTNESYGDLRRWGFEAIARPNEAIKWQPLYSRVSGDLPLMEAPTFTLEAFMLPDTKETYRIVRCAIDCEVAGKVKLLFSQTVPKVCWIAGKPVAAAKEMMVELPTGKSTILLGIEGESPQSLRLEIGDAPGSDARVQIVGGR